MSNATPSSHGKRRFAFSFSFFSSPFLVVFIYCLSGSFLYGKDVVVSDLSISERRQLSESKFLPQDISDLGERLESYRVKVKRRDRVDVAALERDLKELSRIKEPSKKLGKRQLSSYWRVAARSVKAVEGHTPRALELLARAAELDPEDETLAEDVALMRTRLELIENRIKEAKSRKGGGK